MGLTIARALLFGALLYSGTAAAESVFRHCLAALAREAVARPRPEGSGSEVEVRVRARGGSREVHSAIWSMITTEDGTVAPLLGGASVPDFLREKAQLLGSEPLRVRWLSLSDDEQTRLVEHVGRSLAERQYKGTLEAGAYWHFHGVSRRIPGLVLRWPQIIAVPNGPPLQLFGRWFQPGVHAATFPAITTAVEFGRPSDLLDLELVELHFRPESNHDLTAGATALSVRRFLAARGYPRGKQHQHALARKAPSPPLFDGSVGAVAVATKLVFDTNLLAELMLVRALGKSIEDRTDGYGRLMAPMRVRDFPELTHFLGFLATGHPRAHDHEFSAKFKTFTVGVRGPAKFPGYAWSLEFRHLFPSLLSGAAGAANAWMIDVAQAKMQLLSGQLEGGLPGDRAVVSSWLSHAQDLPILEIDDLSECFESAWPSRGRPEAFRRSPEWMDALVDERTRRLLSQPELSERFEIDWLLHDWGRSHYVHLSSEPTENERRRRRLRDAQRAALQALAAQALPDWTRVQPIVQNFLERSGLEELVVESLGTR